MRYRRGVGARATILVVDDDAEFGSAVRRWLEREGHDVRQAHDGVEGLRLARELRPECILLDYRMPGMTGDEVAARVREHDALVQIILVTGVVVDRPARELMRRLEIQGYHSKADAIERLLTLVDAALRAHRQLALMERQSAALRRSLLATPKIHHPQPLAELIANALAETQALLADAEGTETATASVLVATLEEDDAIVIRAATGAWAGMERPGELPAEVGAALASCLRSGRVERAAGSALLLPMRHGGRTLGTIGVADTRAAAQIEDPLALFADQVGVAIENHRLADMASVDSLSSVHSRRHVLARLLEWLQLSARTRQPLSLLLLDVDNLKALNDRHGHVAGDRAIARIGECLRATIRDTDVAGRYGGDEFLVVTPQTGPAGAAVLAERLRAKLAACDAEGAPDPTRLTATIAYGGLEPALLGSWLGGPVARSTWEELARALIAAVDEALYSAKRAGRNRVAAAGTDGWVTTKVATAAAELWRRLGPPPGLTRL